MKRRTYLAAIATLFGGSIAGCAELEEIESMPEDEAKDVFTSVEELDVDDVATIEYAERFVDEELGIAFHAFEPHSNHAGAGTTVTATDLDDEQLAKLD